MKKDVSELRLLSTKVISLKKQKKIKRKMNIMFILGFIIPTINAIYQQVNVNTGDQAYMNVMFGFIALDILIYIPIFIINKDPYSKGKNKLWLLILMQIRILGKFIFALYMLIYFIITRNVSFNMLFTNFIGTMQIIAKDGLSLGMTLASTLFTMIVGGNNNKCRRELFDGSFTYSTYEKNPDNGDIIRKTYINKINPKAYITKRIIMSIIDIAFMALVLFVILWLLK